jgi:hypothetical protein
VDRRRLLRPDTGVMLHTWAEALDQLEADSDAKPAHVMRFGSQYDMGESSPSHPQPTGPSGTSRNTWPRPSLIPSVTTTAGRHGRRTAAGCTWRRQNCDRCWDDPKHNVSKSSCGSQHDHRIRSADERSSTSPAKGYVPTAPTRHLRTLAVRSPGRTTRSSQTLPRLHRHR